MSLVRGCPSVAVWNWDGVKGEEYPGAGGGWGRRLRALSGSTEPRFFVTPPFLSARPFCSRRYQYVA